MKVKNGELLSINDDMQATIQKEVSESQQVLDQMAEEQEEIRLILEQQKQESRKLELDKETRKAVKKEVDAQVKHVKSQVVEIKGIFQSESYVKVPKGLWKQVLQAYEWGMTASVSVEKLKQHISILENNLIEWKAYKKKVTAFLKGKGILEEFKEYLKPKQKSVHEKLDNYKKQSRGTKQIEEQGKSMTVEERGY